MEIEMYTGPLGQTKTMSKEVRQGYYSWNHQRDRCRRKSHPDYKSYGGKGIMVHYSSRDFVSWWLFNLKSFSGKRPTVSRINHSKDYCFENIKMEDASDNSKERIQRAGMPDALKAKAKKVFVKCKRSNELIAIFSSQNEAASFFDIAECAIRYHLSGKSKGSKSHGRFHKIPFLLERGT